MSRRNDVLGLRRVPVPALGWLGLVAVTLVACNGDDGGSVASGSATDTGASSDTTTSTTGTSSSETSTSATETETTASTGPTATGTTGGETGPAKSCSRYDEADCEMGLGCQPIYGKPYVEDIDGFCLGDETFLGCIDCLFGGNPFTICSIETNMPYEIDSCVPLEYEECDPPVVDPPRC